MSTDCESKSILLTIKKMLGSCDIFDVDIIVHINSTIMILQQLGVAPPGFYITGEEDTWDDLLWGSKDLEAVKSFIYLKTRLAFDPPTSSFVVDSIEKMIKELEWRLNVQAEGGCACGPDSQCECE